MTPTQIQTASVLLGERKRLRFQKEELIRMGGWGDPVFVTFEARRWHYSCPIAEEARASINVYPSESIWNTLLEIVDARITEITRQLKELGLTESSDSLEGTENV